MFTGRVKRKINKQFFVKVLFSIRKSKLYIFYFNFLKMSVYQCNNVIMF